MKWNCILKMGLISEGIDFKCLILQDQSMFDQLKWLTSVSLKLAQFYNVKGEFWNYKFKWMNK